jgi:hypothetical protein
LDQVSQKKNKKILPGRAWWITPIIPALEKKRQKDHEFKISRVYKISSKSACNSPQNETLSQKKKKQTKKREREHSPKSFQKELWQPY